MSDSCLQLGYRKTRHGYNILQKQICTRFEKELETKKYSSYRPIAINNTTVMKTVKYDEIQEIIM